jgi:hypothetical protein
LFEFQDLESGIAWKFNARTDVIERVPALKVRGNMVTDLQLPMVLHSLINPSHEQHDVLGGERILKTSSGRVEEGEHEWTEFLIRVQKANNASDERVVRVRLNAESQLPALWEVRDANGATAVTLFDYPANGPTNIFDLGVPKTATVIDHVPTGELSHIIESLKADRGRFDDYDAIAVEQLEGTKTKFDPSFKNSSIKRIRRSGHRYRIDQLLTAKRTLAAPSKDESMGEWWLNNREQFWSVPQLLCDGQHTSLYQMTDGRIIPLTKPNLSVILAKENTGRLPSDDPAVEWPSLMPEYSCRPHLWEFDENRSFEMTPKADDGPPGSIRVVVSGSRGRWSGELYRYWFDPKRNYVLLQSTATFFKKDSDLVPLTTTDKFDDFTQSPSGKWFPQLVRRTTTDPQAAGRTEVTRFYVDFAVDLPAGLFSSSHAENDE